MRTVYHGLNPADYPFSPEHSGYVLFLGRMGPHKNPDGAIRIARAAGYPIVLVGAPQDGGERRYFQERVEPLLGVPGVTYVGAVSQSEKVRLLRGAAALVFPILWDEHFGLVMIEAMACGTPVIATHRGSVPEVVDDGLTGYIGQSEADLVASLAHVGDLDRSAVAGRMRERFSLARMTTDYEDFYRHSIAGA